MEGSDFTVLMDEIVFEVGSGNGTRRCVNFTEISSDMVLEGFHQFVVVVNETSPPINIDEYAQYLKVYVIDNDSEYKCNMCLYSDSLSDERHWLGNLTQLAINCADTKFAVFPP